MFVKPVLHGLQTFENRKHILYGYQTKKHSGKGKPYHTMFLSNSKEQVYSPKLESTLRKKQTQKQKNEKIPSHSKTVLKLQRHKTFFERKDLSSKR